jgi:hypothetical protein
MLPKLREGTYKGCGPNNKRELAILRIGKDGWDGYYQAIVYDTKGVKLYDRMQPRKPLALAMGRFRLLKSQP